MAGYRPSSVLRFSGPRRSLEHSDTDADVIY